MIRFLGRVAVVLPLFFFSADPVAAQPDSKKLLQRASEAVEDGFFSIGERYAEAVVEKSRSREEQAAARLVLARVAIGSGHGVEALEMLLALESEASVPPDAIRYWRAAALVSAGRSAEALEVLELFRRDYPQSQLAVDAARLRVRALYLDRGPEAAKTAFDELARDFPSAEATPGHLLDWGSLLVLAGERERASQTFERLLKEFPLARERGEAAIQLARMHFARNDGTGAVFLEDVLAATGMPTRLRAKAGEEWSAWLVRGREWEKALQVTEDLRELDIGSSRKAWYAVQAGLLQIRVGSVTNGLALFNEALAGLQDPADAADSMLRLGRVLLEEGIFEEAEKVLQNYLEAFPGEKGSSRALSFKGWVLWEEKKFLEAAKTFERAYAMETGPARVEYLVKAADSLFAAARFTAARDHYEKAAAETADPALALQCRYQAAECFSRTEQWPEALALLDRLAEESLPGPMGEKALLRMATLHEDQGRLEEAVKTYTAAIPRLKSPTSQARAIHSRGMLNYRLGEFRSALTDFNRVYTEFPNDPAAEQADYMRGWAEYLLGDYSNALAICSAFLSTRSSSPYAADVRFWVAQYFFNQGNYPEAEVGFKAVADRYPAGKLSDTALYWAGRAAMRVNEYLRAIEHFSRLGRDYPASQLLPETRFAQGESLSQLGQFSGAILAYEQLLRDYPEHVLAIAAWGRKGDCQFTLGSEDQTRYREAAVSYRQVLDAAAASEEERFQARYKVGRCFEKMGESAKALEHYMDVIYGYFDAVDEGRRPVDLWFIRAVLSAADLFEADGQLAQAIAVCNKLVEAGLPAAEDARRRIAVLEERLERVRLENESAGDVR